MKVTCLDCGRRMEPKYACSICGKDDVVPESWHQSMDKLQMLLNDSIEENALMAQVFDDAVAYIEATEYAAVCPTRGLIKTKYRDLARAVSEYQEKDL